MKSLQKEQHVPSGEEPPTSLEGPRPSPEDVDVNQLREQLYRSEAENESYRFEPSHTLADKRATLALAGARPQSLAVDLALKQLADDDDDFDEDLFYSDGEMSHDDDDDDGDGNGDKSHKSRKHRRSPRVRKHRSSRSSTGGHASSSSASAGRAAAAALARSDEPRRHSTTRLMRAKSIDNSRHARRASAMSRSAVLGVSAERKIGKSSPTSIPSRDQLYSTAMAHDSVTEEDFKNSLPDSVQRAQQAKMSIDDTSENDDVDDQGNAVDAGDDATATEEGDVAKDGDSARADDAGDDKPRRRRSKKKSKPDAAPAPSSPSEDSMD